MNLQVAKATVLTPLVRWIARSAVLATLFAGGVTASAQTTYYVSNGGLDTNDGLSENSPWRTLARVTEEDQTPGGFGPGDQILLQRGGVWNEADALKLSSRTNGASRVLGVYGSAAQAPRISRFQRGLTADCVVINSGRWRIEGIQFENAYRGLRFHGLLSGGSNVEISGCYFRNIENRTNQQDMSAGIRFEDFPWSDVTIQDCTFERVSSGIWNFTPGSSGFVIRNCDFFGGWGAGVALQNVNDAQIVGCRIRDVGGMNVYGSTGLFLVSCENVIIDGCSISGVRHGGNPVDGVDFPDGCGVDFESNNTNCLLINTSIYDTEGPAVLMLTGPSNSGDPTLENVNIEIRDCLFFNTNTVRHGIPGSSVDQDGMLFQAGSPASTGSIVNCGLYANRQSSGHVRGNWAGFSITGLLKGDHVTGWKPVYGRFDDLSVGGNGHVCAVDSNDRVFTWNGRYTGACWIEALGLTSAENASVGEDGALWATDTQQRALQFVGGAWVVESAGPFVSVSAGSAANVWALSPLGVPHLRENGVFAPVAGPAADQLDAGPNLGEAWSVAGTTIRRYERPINVWTVVPGALTQVSFHGAYQAAPDKPVRYIAAGVNGAAIRRTIDPYDQGANEWRTLPGLLVKVSEGSDGMLWGLDSNGHVWRYQ